MLIVTAFNQSYAQIGSLCVQSIMRYCRDHPEYRFVSHLIPDDYARPASWFKLDLIKRYLPEHDSVLWLDADAVIVGKGDLKAIMKDATLNISKDANGPNHGVACWKSCHQSFDAIKRMNAAYEKHKDHPWFEQAALMEFIDELDVNYLPKEIFNAYGEGVTGESDVCEDTVIIHWPGCGEERTKYMEEALAA